MDSDKIEVVDAGSQSDGGRRGDLVLGVEGGVTDTGTCVRLIGRF